MTQLKGIQFSAGTLLIGGASAVATLNMKGGTCVYQTSAGIATALTVGGSAGATFDASVGNTARAIALLNIKPNMTIIDPLRSLTYTAIAFNSDVRTWQAS